MSMHGLRSRSAFPESASSPENARYAASIVCSKGPHMNTLASPHPTERTRLRPFTQDDKLLIRNLCADPRVMRFFPSPLDEAASAALLEKILAHQTRYGFSLWAVEERSTAIFMGFTGLLHVSFSAPFTPCVEIGWRFLPEFQGLGLACEAARSALHHGFHRLNLPEIVAFTAVANLPSQRLMQRLGMSHDPADDFDHPLLPPGNALRRHVLYRLQADHCSSLEPDSSSRTP